MLIHFGFSFFLDDYKTLRMSNINNSEHEITTNTDSNRTTAEIGRSFSSARFQIARVSQTETNSDTLSKAPSIPTSKNRLINFNIKNKSIFRSIISCSTNVRSDREKNSNISRW